MRLYFEGDQIRRKPQPRLYKIGNCTYAYDRSLRLWVVLEHDAEGNAVVQPNGETAIYCLTQGQAVIECMDLEEKGRN